MAAHFRAARLLLAAARRFLTAAHRKMTAWSSGLCGCFSDCCSCWTVFCVPCVALGQLSQKVLGYSCVVVTMFFLCVYALAYSFEIYADLPHAHPWRNGLIGCAGEPQATHARNGVLPT